MAKRKSARHVKWGRQIAEEFLIRVIKYVRKVERTRKTRPSARTLARAYLDKVKHDQT